MSVIFKLAIVLIVVCGFFITAWNFKAADDGDKRAKKCRNIGIGLFAVGEVAGLSLWLLGVL